jgi:hypothetical protein
VKVPDSYALVCSCGLGEQTIRWRGSEPLDTAVGRALKKLYATEPGATLSGTWRIVHTDPGVVQIESEVKDSTWHRIGVITVNLDRPSGAATKWFQLTRAG